MTEESRFSMNRAEATTSGMILPGRSGISDDLEIGSVPFWFWILRVHFLELAANDASDRGVAHPVAVGRYHMPWRPFGGTAGERDLIGCLIILPKLAVLEIAGLNFHCFFGLSSRSIRRCFCSSGEMWSMNFKIAMPFSTECFSNWLI